MFRTETPKIEGQWISVDVDMELTSKFKLVSAPVADPASTLVGFQNLPHNAQRDKPKGVPRAFQYFPYHFMTHVRTTFHEENTCTIRSLGIYSVGIMPQYLEAVVEEAVGGAGC